MKHLLLSIFIVFITGCVSPKNTRDSELVNLEKPPGSRHAEQKTSQEQEDSSLSGEVNKGLYADVYTIDGQDKTITIKRKLDESWELIGKAIRISGIKITGKNQKNGSYQVSYKSGGLLDGFSLFGSTKASKYLIKLDEHVNETKVNISKIEDEEDVDPSRLKDGAPDFSYDNSAKLRDLLFMALQHDVPL